ncbi:exo-alpha-sialidase, partial [bacterium]|nr:exo-alpha-sialidase [bacterium]
GGITWHDSLLEEPSYPRHSDPGLTCDRLGNVYVVILSYTGSTSDPNGLFVLKSTDGGVTWDDAVTVIDGVPGVFEDKELIACDRSGGTHDGNLYVAWARFGMDTDILSARSTDGASSFDAPALVSDADGVQWPVPAVGPDGTVYVAWANYSPASIRLDRSYDGGATFGTDVTVASTYTAQTYVNGPVLVFSYPAMDCDITGGLFDGRLYIAYMDRGGGDQDIFLRYSDDGGTTWSSPLRINDDAYGNGADQFHPWLVVSEDGVVNVVFYDRRNDPGNLLMDVYVAQSFDGGASFESNVRVTTVSSDPTAGSVRAGLIGEYIGLAAATSERLHPVWTDTREGNQDTYTAIVDTTFVDVAELPPITSLRLSSPCPNPFRDGVEIAFHAPHAPLITCRIVDVAGREVTRLSATPSDDGTGTLSWNGADSQGSPVSSGVYFLKASSAGASETLKLVLLR